MRLDHSVIDGIDDLNVIGCRCKLIDLIEIYAIPFDYSIVIIDSRILNKVTTFYLGVVKTTFTVYFIGFSCYGRWAIQIGVFRGFLVMQLFRIENVIRIF